MSRSRSGWSPLPSLLVLCLASGSLASSELVAQAGGARLGPRPVELPASFEAALSAETRAEDGRPGAAYWQQEAHYAIEAELDPETGRLRGREVITYVNHAPAPLRFVVLRLEQNVFSEGARRNRRAPITGGLTLERLQVDGEDAPNRHVGGSYYEALTLLQVQLPNPLPPGGRAEIEVAWSFTVPPAPTFRQGNLNGEIFAVAQWYPRLAVYDDVYGWDVTPYLGDGEFYLEYGDFDVEITVPPGWIVAATGTLENADQVLRAEALERLRSAREADTAVAVIGAEEVRRGETTRSGPGFGGTGSLTWRFTARDVRDFAFATSANYVWDATGVEVAGRGERALVQAFYRPGGSAWTRGAQFAAHGVRTLSRWLGPFPYPQLTTAETPVGGMEYPMILFNPSTNSDDALAGVTIHEAAHQWFPMVVGTMEAKHAWMDEGIVTYWEELSLADLLGEQPPRWGSDGSYLGVAGREVEVPLMRHTDLVSPYGARGVAAYSKPAVALGALREVMGEEAFTAAFRDFYESWRFRHPQPWDFFHTMERHYGEELDWFWRPLFFETDVLDHAVASVTPVNGSTTIRIEDRGRVILPTPIRVTMEDGSVREELISPRTWLEGGRVQELTVYRPVVQVDLDPEERFPDVDRSNNRWSRQ